MQNDSILFSLIIPTKNRLDTAFATISALPELLSDKISEVVVFDTSDNRDLEVMLSDVLDKNAKLIKYFHSPVSGFAETFEASLEKATGKFISIIGDDDSVTSEIENVCKWCDENNVESLTPKNSISYFWPNFTSKYSGDRYAATMLIGTFKGSLNVLSSEEMYADLRNSSLTNYNRLPRLYFGIVSRKLLDKATEMHGRAFVGPSPDASNALLLLDVSTKHYFLDYPLFIAGGSANSGTGKSAKGTHFGSVLDAPMLNDYVSSWPREIPFVYSPESVWVLTAFNTFDLTNPQFKRLFKNEIFFGKLLADNIKHFRKISSIINEFYIQRNSNEKLLHGVLIFKSVVSEIHHKICRFLYWRFASYIPMQAKVIKNVKNTKQATEFLRSNLPKLKM